MCSETDRLLSGVLERARSWAAECRELGWLQTKDVDRFDRIELRSPSALFRNAGQRPLVVAFFGGTGVGKSTLLNRLAGHEVARTGVVRPTSREVSLYLHRSLDLHQLPENFPIEKVLIDRHSHDEMSIVLWIDMPDIDSTEKSNREMVLEWLPHIDLLVYVVSPERYRDETGWRLLLSEGSRHAWLFIMNQFDRGDASQLKALYRQLLDAGFKDPVVLACDCSGIPSATEDDFKQLKDSIDRLANRHTVRQLELRNVLARMHEIEINIGIGLGAMGSTEAIEGVLKKWESIWSDAANDLDEGMQWPIQEAARCLGSAGGDRTLIKRLASAARLENQSQNPRSINPVLWDE
ncbi:MAG: GTPase, partial [Methylococcales bacterium]